MNLSNRIGLGTVQWGMPYGVANRTGKPAMSQVHDMLVAAKTVGVEVIDTARDYGDAEAILGGLISSSRFRIITKTPFIKTDQITGDLAQRFKRSFQTSLARLGRRMVDGLLVHEADNLLAIDSGRLWDVLVSEREAGRVRKIGCSVYHPEQLDRILDRYAIDLVQLPLNVYDQRFIAHGSLRRLKNAGVEVHSRSTFLQGVLVMPPNSLSSSFAHLRERQEELHSAFARSTHSPLSGCVAFALQQDVDVVLVGCDLPTQLAEILTARASGMTCSLESFALNDLSVIDPSRWTK